MIHMNIITEFGPFRKPDVLLLILVQRSDEVKRNDLRRTLFDFSVVIRVLVVLKVLTCVMVGIGR